MKDPTQSIIEQALSGNTPVADNSIAKIQDMVGMIASLRQELSAALKNADSLKSALDAANGRIAVMEGVINNAYDTAKGK